MTKGPSLGLSSSRWKRSEAPFRRASPDRRVGTNWTSSHYAQVSRRSAKDTGLHPVGRLQGLIALTMVAYGVSTLVVHRPPSGYNTFWDGWCPEHRQRVARHPSAVARPALPPITLGLAGHGGRSHAVHAGRSRLHLPRPEPQSHPQPGP